MAASYSDKAVLAADPGFQGRVKASLIAACVAISNEGWTVVFHEQRMRYAVGVLNSPGSFAPLFANAVANDAGVIGDATAGGTVALTAGNVVAQGALVTDAHLDVAVAASFGSFIVPL